MYVKNRLAQTRGLHVDGYSTKCKTGENEENTKTFWACFCLKNCILQVCILAFICAVYLSEASPWKCLRQVRAFLRVSWVYTKVESYTRWLWWCPRRPKLSNLLLRFLWQINKQGLNMNFLFKSMRVFVCAQHLLWKYDVWSDAPNSDKLYTY